MITFFNEEYKPVEDVRFDAKTEDVSVTNCSEDKTLSMFLHQDCFGAMLKYPYMWIEYVSNDSALEKDSPIVQQLIPLWHLFNTTMRLFVQK